MSEKGKGPLPETALRILDELPWAVVFLSAVEFRVVYLNQAYRHFLPRRFQGSDLVGTKLSELIGGEKSPILGILRNVSERKEKVAYKEFKFTSDDGSEFWVEWSVLPIENGTERADLLVTIKEIPERRALQIELSDSEERYVKLMQASQDAIIMTDLQGQPVYRSPRAQEMFRSRPEEVGLDENLRDHVAPEHLELVRENFQRLLRGDTAPSGIVTLMRGDGTRFSAEVSAESLKDRWGRPSGMLFVIRDVTETVRVKGELTVAEGRSRSIIQAAPWGMHFYELRKDGSLVFMGANPSADRMLGIDHSDLVGLKIQEAFPAHANSDIPRIYALVASTGEPWHAEEVDYQDNRLSGAFEVHAFQTGPGSMVAMFIDITTRKQAEELSTALNRLNSYISSTLDYEIIMQRVVEEGCKALGSDSALINLKEGDKWVARFVYKFPESILGVPKSTEESPTSMLVAEERKAIAIDDPQNDPRVDGASMRDFGILSVLVAPIIIRDEVLGVIAFYHRTYKARFTEAQVDFANKLGASLSLAIANADLFRAVKDKSDLLESIIRGAPTGIILFDGQDLSIKLINDFFKTNFLEEPYKHMDLTGKRLPEFIPGSEGTLVPELLRLVARTGVPHLDHEFEFAAFKRGTTYWDLVYYPIGEEGNRDVLLIANEVTEQIRARKTLEELAMQTEHESARLRAVLDSLPVGVSIVDSNGNLIEANQMTRTIWGWEMPLVDSYERYSAYKAWWFDTHRQLAPEDWPTVKTLRDGNTRIGDVLNIQTFDGRMTTIMHSVAPIKDASGNVLGAVVVIQDIAERIRLDQELQKQTRDLRRSNEELQAFAYVASHDLQEPLRMVINSLSLLDRHYHDSLDPRAHRYISIAVEGGGRMKSLIDDLLEYSRLDADRRGSMPVDMNRVVATTLERLAVAIEDSQARIRVGQLPTLEANETQMVQLMQNLVSNAIKFHGDEPPLVEVACQENVDEYIFSVKDNGIGFNPAYNERVFQMFQRLHTREDYPGTGVGLPIAKKIVERHGGRIWVESEEGKGATFFFSLPKSGPSQAS